jgi:hypothetical protein
MIRTNFPLQPEVIMPRSWAFIFLLPFLFLTSCETVKQAADKPALSLAEGESTYPIRLARVYADIKRGTVVGQYQSGMLCIPDLSGSELQWHVGRNDISDAELAIAFRDELRGAGYTVVSAQSNMFDDEENERARARFKIGAIITDIKANICKPGNGLLTAGKLGGDSYVKVRWQVYDNFNRAVVYDTNTEGSATVSSSSGTTEADILLAAFSKAARNLLADQGFHDLMVQKKEKPVAETDRVKKKRFEIAARGAYSSSLKKNLEKIRGQVVTVMVDGGHGSGFFIADGWALTNHHVVGNAGQVGLKTISGREIVADVVATNARRDVALLKTEKIGLSGIPLKLAEPDISDRVYVLGSPVETFCIVVPTLEK